MRGEVANSSMCGDETEGISRRGGRTFPLISKTRGEWGAGWQKEKGEATSDLAFVARSPSRT